MKDRIAELRIFPPGPKPGERLASGLVRGLAWGWLVGGLVMVLSGCTPQRTTAAPSPSAVPVATTASPADPAAGAPARQRGPGPLDSGRPGPGTFDGIFSRTAPEARTGRIPSPGPDRDRVGVPDPGARFGSPQPTERVEEAARPVQAPPVAAPAFPRRGDPQPFQPAAAPAVTVGVVLPLSGRHGGLGRRMLEAAQFALLDVSPDSFVLEVADSRGTADGARQAVQSLLDRRAGLIIGPLLSSSVAAAAPLAQQAGVNMLVFTTDRAQARPGVYVMGFLPRADAERLVSFLSVRNLRRVGVLAPDNTYGRVVVEEIRRAAGLYGTVLTAAGFYDAQSRNYDAAVRAFAAHRSEPAQPVAANPLPLPDLPAQEQRVVPEFDFDVVILPDSGNSLREVAALLSYYQVTPDLVRFAGTGVWDELRTAGEPALQGGWFVAPDPAARRSFETRFNEMFGAVPPRLATLAYDATSLAISLAVRPPVPGSPPFSRASITSPSGFLGLDGIFRFLPDGVVERRLAILAATEEEPRLIDPAPVTFRQARSPGTPSPAPAAGR